jgi:hypothetical protein
MTNITRRNYQNQIREALDRIDLVHLLLLKNEKIKFNKNFFINLLLYIPSTYIAENPSLETSKAEIKINKLRLQRN